MVNGVSALRSYLLHLHYQMWQEYNRVYQKKAWGNGIFEFYAGAASDIKKKEHIMRLKI